MNLDQAAVGRDIRNTVDIKAVWKICRRTGKDVVLSEGWTRVKS